MAAARASLLQHVDLEYGGQAAPDRKEEGVECDVPRPCIGIGIVNGTTVIVSEQTDFWMDNRENDGQIINLNTLVFPALYRILPVVRSV